MPASRRYFQHVGVIINAASTAQQYDIKLERNGPNARPLQQRTRRRSTGSYGHCPLILIMTALAHTDGDQPDPAGFEPPATRRDDIIETVHGVKIADPYRWLEDQDSAETREWITEQVCYTRAFLDSLPGRAKLKQRLTDLINVDTIGIPVERAGWYYFGRRSKDQEQAILYRRRGPHGKDEVLIDPHAMSADRTTSVSLLDISKDGSILVYAIRQGGEDEIEVRLLDIGKGRDIADGLPKSRIMGVSLNPDKSGFYYTRHELALGSRVYYHALPSNVADDIEVFGEGYGPDKGISAELSEDGRFLLLTVWHGSAATKSEIHVLDIEQRRVQPIVHDIDARFGGSIVDDRLYLHTNWEAPSGRILLVDLKQPARDNWREIIPSEDAVIDDFSLIGGRLFVSRHLNVPAGLWGRPIRVTKRLVRRIRWKAEPQRVTAP